VENSIKHGILKGQGSGSVNIKIKKHNLKDVKVTIEDDGPGVPQAVIDSIYAGTASENKIGMANVDTRLRHIYGAGLTIEHLSVGTRISFVLHENYKSL
jgi:two-component system LytT family sensor kinase